MLIFIYLRFFYIYR